MRPAACIVLITGLLGAGIAFAGDPGFNEVVRSIESQYSTKRLKIPLFGLVNAVAKVVKPFGTSEIRMAIFEDLDVQAGEENRFAGIVRESLDRRWRPLVRVHSRRDSECTSIWVREVGKQMKLFLAVQEPGEAVLIQVKVQPEVLARWLEEPLTIAHRVTVDQDY